jgi:hypothetical protein
MTGRKADIKPECLDSDPKQWKSEAWHQPFGGSGFYIGGYACVKKSDAEKLIKAAKESEFREHEQAGILRDQLEAKERSYQMLYTEAEGYEKRAEKAEAEVKRWIKHAADRTWELMQARAEIERLKGAGQ